MCRSGAVGGSAFRPFSAGRGSVCAVGEALGETSKLGSHEKDGFLSKVPGLVVGIEGGVRSALGQGGVSGAETAHVTAVESESPIGLLEVTESDAVCGANAASAAVARPTAGESKGIIGSFLLSAGRCHLHVHAVLPALLLLRLHVFALVLLSLLCLLLLPMRILRSCMMHVPLRGRTRVGLRVPREGGVPKIGFPVRPKICALSQIWRQG